MKSFFKKIAGIWAELGRSIFVGDRYQKNMRGIAIGAALIVVMNLLSDIMYKIVDPRINLE